MITDFSNSPIKSIYITAKKLAGYPAIKNQVLSLVNAEPGFDVATKLAIRIMADRLPSYNNGVVNLDEAELLAILYMPWESAGIAEVDALTSEQREAIFQVVMGVCKSIINDHAATLTSLTKSEHRFLELAIRSLLPYGFGAFLCPYNFWEKRPKALVKFCDENEIELLHQEKLGGGFSQTSVQVELFLFRKGKDS